ncbi:RDD family protein [Kitasatospora sp. NPDC058032]|uniref:RDD family protein n=2 Tax=unclassified Kitasatospora TaxID=2633591 RepID=UPI0036D9867A
MSEERWKALVGPGRARKEPRPAVPGMADWSTRACAFLLEVSIAGGIMTTYTALLYYARPPLALLQAVALLLSVHLEPVYRFLYWALPLVFLVWQWAVRGRTGQSLGQRVMRIVTVDEDTARPLGPARSIVRSLLHVVDVAPGFFGFVRPLVHHRRQTWADQISRSVVVDIDVINQIAEVRK